MKSKFFKTGIRFMMCFFLFSFITIEETAAQGCSLTEIIEATGSGSLLDRINEQIKGFEYKISKRKKLIVHRATRVESLPNGKIEVTAKVTLKRKIRRDANGNIKITMSYSFNRAKCKICIGNPHIDQVKLSNTLRIGEAIYKKAANLMLPNKICKEIER